jgi:transposase-like protein
MRAEIERLRRELEETKEKLDFAKKAAAFFAQQSK